MKISIVIPTLQEAAAIGNLITYLWENGQEMVQEIIVVDGGSTDSTIKAASAAGATVRHSAPSRAKQMNVGAAEASAEVLYFVHADTIPPVTFARDILTEIAAGYAMGCYRYQFNSPQKILKLNAWFVRFNWLWCQGGDKTFFIRKDIFEAFNGYDEKYVVMEEYDFLRRAMKKYTLKIIPKNVLVSARKYEKNSWLRVQIANFVAFSLFRMGKEPKQIKGIYQKLLC